MESDLYVCHPDPVRRGSGLPRLHVFPTLALRSCRDTVLPRGLWRMTEAARRSLTRASSVGVIRIKCEQDARLFSPVTGGVHSALNTGGMRSSQGMGRASNTCITEVRPLTLYAAHGQLSS